MIHVMSRLFHLLIVFHNIDRDRNWFLHILLSNGIALVCYGLDHIVHGLSTLLGYCLRVHYIFEIHIVFLNNLPHMYMYLWIHMFRVLNILVRHQILFQNTCVFHSLNFHSWLHNCMCLVLYMFRVLNILVHHRYWIVFHCIQIIYIFHNLHHYLRD